jgi:hypothetical protein
LTSAWSAPHSWTSRAHDTAKALGGGGGGGFDAGSGMTRRASSGSAVPMKSMTAAVNTPTHATASSQPKP